MFPLIPFDLVFDPCLQVKTAVATEADSKNPSQEVLQLEKARVVMDRNGIKRLEKEKGEQFHHRP